MGSLKATFVNHFGGICRQGYTFLVRKIDFDFIETLRRQQFSIHHRDIALSLQSNMKNRDSDGVASSHIGPVKMTVSSPDFRSLFTPGLSHIKELFQQNNYELCFAGGAVRDLLTGITPKDIDFATTATPEEMIEMFKKENIRMINEGGVSHGTVTCRAKEENFEITTLRIDKITDGRHAVVEFTKDWRQDASRRDLTINSIFLDLQGNVIDFFDGIEDLRAKRVRFVGNAETRIQEDYLRILRYFRFFGRIADDDAEFDEEAISAITANGEGLVAISGPRIWMEMKKILTGNYIAKILRQMYHCGILQYIGFPEQVNIDALEDIYNNTKHLNVNHMTYTSALLSTEQDVLKLEERTQFSRVERKTALFIVAYRDKINLNDPSRLKYCQDILFDGPDSPLMNSTTHSFICNGKYIGSYVCNWSQKIPAHEGGHKDFIVEVLKYIGDFETMKQLQDWKIPKFPVNGKILAEAGVPKGKSIGVVMKLLKEKWKESYFLLSANELLELVPKILESL